MEKLLQMTKLPRIVLVPLGVALVVFSYWLAGGRDRATPLYGSQYGCKFGAIDELTFVIPSERYSQYELLGCLPPYYLILYPLAILGVIMCGWGLVTSARGIFRPDRIWQENVLNGIVAILASPLMVWLGMWMLNPQISFMFGGGISTLGDIFDTVSITLMIMGVLIFPLVIILAIVAASRRIRLSA